MKVVIVGAGPRGTSVMERLIAQFAAQNSTLPQAQLPRLAIHMVDPYAPGAGHVWRREQSRLYLMNTQSFFPTLIPDQGVQAQPLAGVTFDAWRVLMQKNIKHDAGNTGHLPSTGPTSFELNAEDTLELSALAATDFPSRPLYGSYLSWCFDQLRSALPGGVTLTIHPTHALKVVRGQANGGFDVVLENGHSLGADRVVLALGHVDSELSPAQTGLEKAAEDNGLIYVPPAVPADVDWAAIPERETVLVRGMGLNFFDVLGQLTEGRGGRFVPTGKDHGQSLEYRASGHEPLIVGASRRGTPYRAKAELAAYYPKSVTLRFLNEDAALAIHAMGATAGFEHDIWPLLHRDTLWAYYTTLARTQPSAILVDGFLDELDVVLHSGLDGNSAHWAGQLSALVAESVNPESMLDLRALARPLSRPLPGMDTKHRFTSQSALDAAVLSYLVEDAVSSARGEDDPLKMAIGALNAGRAVVKSLVVDGGITQESWLGELRGWFEGFVEGLASGPPALRMEQLAALVRAGVVQFTGPDPLFTLRDGHFKVSSPWVEGEAWRADTLIEALAPSNRVKTTASPLLEQLLADGLVRPKIMIASDGDAEVTSGLDVSLPPYRPLDADGHVVDGLYVLGLQLSSVQWGTAIAAQSGATYRSGYRTVLDADAIAADILA